MFHGASSSRGMEQLVGWSRGDHGEPVWECFLQEGYVVIVADYHGGNMNAVNSPITAASASAIDDGIAVINYVRSLSYVNDNQITAYGASLDGNLVMCLASLVPDLHAIVAGAPFSIWFLGTNLPTDGSRAGFSNLNQDKSISMANIAPI